MHKERSESNESEGFMSLNSSGRHENSSKTISKIEVHSSRCHNKYNIGQKRLSYHNSPKAQEFMKLYKRNSINVVCTTERVSYSMKNNFNDTMRSHNDTKNDTIYSSRNDSYCGPEHMKILDSLLAEESPPINTNRAIEKVCKAQLKRVETYSNNRNFVIGSNKEKVNKRNSCFVNNNGTNREELQLGLRNKRVISIMPAPVMKGLNVYNKAFLQADKKTDRIDLLERIPNKSLLIKKRSNQEEEENIFGFKND